MRVLIFILSVLVMCAVMYFAGSVGNSMARFYSMTGVLALSFIAAIVSASRWGTRP